MELKLCTRCGVSKPATEEFFSPFKMKSGNLTLSSRCKPCKAAYTREWNKAKGIRKTEQLPEGVKRCNTCKQILQKNSENFYAVGEGKKRFFGTCKECCRIVARLKREPAKRGELQMLTQSQRNEIARGRRKAQLEMAKSDPALQEKIEAKRERRNAQRRMRNPEQRAKASRQASDWAKRNPERCAENARRRIAQKLATPEEREALREKWREASRKNVESRRNAGYRRRAREKSADGNFTYQEALQKLKMQNMQCYYCKRTLTGKSWTADHYIPLSKGGSNGIENIVIACRSCNSSKCNRLPEDWKPRRVY